MTGTEQIFIEEVVHIVDPCSGECAVEKGSHLSKRLQERERAVSYMGSGQFLSFSVLMVCFVWEKD